LVGEYSMEEKNLKEMINSNAGIEEWSNSL
jgi:hypothetical protein